jgi:aminoglycoside phosphotransferase
MAAIYPGPKRPAPAYKEPQLSRADFDRTETFRKDGDAFRLRREVEAMIYAKSHTSIPIPSVLEVHLEDKDEISWILMERLPGQQLGECWPTMSEGARAETIRQLKKHLEQLRRLHPVAPGWIGSCSGGPAYDHRINNMALCGPFSTVSEFHDFLVAPVRDCPRPEWVDKYRRLLPDSHGIVFSHADISWENILVERTTGDVTGIVDWEMAGFWPDWWEYRKALFASRDVKWWRDIVMQVMQEYSTETETDMELEMF